MDKVCLNGKMEDYSKVRKDTYRKTGYPGIKQRLSDNKYIVVIDYGRQLRMNPKTGLMEMKQAKTTKIVSTLKEAKALQGENNKVKKSNKISKVADKIPFNRALAEYTAYYKDGWSDSYMMQKKSQAKRMQDKLFLTAKDIMDITGFGESLTYQFLKEPPFRVQKVGSKILIFSNSFWDWYNLVS